jgi:hypothetical protein
LELGFPEAPDGCIKELDRLHHPLPTVAMIRSALAALLLLAVAPVVHAQDSPTKPVSDKTLSDFTIGEIISGEKADAEALKGKVVAIEFWGRL